MADTLDHDVHALKEWLRVAWCYLAEPSLTRFERQEIRNQMRQSDAELRACLERVAARDRAQRQSGGAPGRSVQRPEFRILSL